MATSTWHWEIEVKLPDGDRWLSKGETTADANASGEDIHDGLRASMAATGRAPAHAKTLKFKAARLA